MAIAITSDRSAEGPRGEPEAGRVLPQIARQAVAAALADGPSLPPHYERGFLAEPHPVFVTIRDVTGELRGCIGTLAPKCADVVTETWRMAREAAFHDPRFPRVERRELDHLRFEVSVLHPLEEVADPAILDPHRFGIVVSTPDGRRGALLPAIEGINTTPHQLAIARRKGAIDPHEDIRIERFEVDRFEE